MSRIHDALKKAELERAQMRQGDSETAVAEQGDFPPAVAAVPTSQKARTSAQAPGGLAPSTPLLEFARAITWKPRQDKLLSFNSHGQTLGGEEFRTLRSRLYQLRDRTPVRSLLVTSALPAEGKTFVTANLAQVIARQHERSALLIDGDLRRSNMHELLGAPAAPGLSEYLRGEAEIADVVQRGPQDNIFFIPGGRHVSNPAELIAGERLQKLVDTIAPLVDWILIDSPPAVLVSDASLIAKVCDGVLLVVRAEETPFDLAQRARQEFADKNVLGVVLNCMSPGRGYSSYYYSHYHAPDGKPEG